MVGATRTALDQPALRSHPRPPRPTRQRTVRHRYVDDVITPRNATRYVKVRSGVKAKKPAPAKRRSSVPVPSVPRQSRSTTLRRDMVRRNRPHRRRRLQLKRLVLTSLAILTLAVGGLMSYDSWCANRIIQAQATELTHDANVADKAAEHVTSNTAKPTTQAPTNPAPATNMPNTDDLASYTVAPDMPRYLVIPKLGVKARVKQLGLASDGSVATPSNVFDTGWFKGSARPGTPGAALIDGHISSWTTHGVFYGLKDLKPGDEMQIVRGDGHLFTYQVVKTQTYTDTNTDMTAALTPVDSSASGLNLISCYGSVKPGTNEFNQRIVVFTKQIGG